MYIRFVDYDILYTVCVENDNGKSSIILRFNNVSWILKEKNRNATLYNNCILLKHSESGK